jgi:hypothetical protein
MTRAQPRFEFGSLPRDPDLDSALVEVRDPKHQRDEIVLSVDLAKKLERTIAESELLGQRAIEVAESAARRPLTRAGISRSCQTPLRRRCPHCRADRSRGRRAHLGYGGGGAEHRRVDLLLICASRELDVHRWNGARGRRDLVPHAIVSDARRPEPSTRRDASYSLAQS